MMEETLPANLNEFLQMRMRDLTDAARLLIVIDPGGRLALTETLTQGRRTWHVVRYDENDLAFRKRFNPNEQTLIWVTGRFGATEQTTIEVSSIVDVFRQADEMIDCSLTGALGKLVPNETFPLAPILEHADSIGSHLGAVAQAVPTLRLHLAPRAALDGNTTRALVLYALAPTFDIKRFLFQHRAPSSVLRDYVLLAWSHDWDERGQALLREQARTASRLDLGELTAWFDAPTLGVARFLYFYRFLSRVRVPNVVNQVRGLGVLGFDPEPLEHGLDAVLRLWENDPAWRKRVIRQVENSTGAEEIRRAVDLIPLDSPARVAEVLNRVETPAFLYEIGLRLAHFDKTYKKLPALMRIWRERRPTLLNDFQADETPYVRGAHALATLLDELSIMLTRVTQAPASASRLEDLLAWYVDGNFYEMEYAHAQAQRAIHRLPASERQSFQNLLKRIRVNIRTFLDQADHVLGKAIAEDWHGFLSSKQLALNVLWDFVKTPNLKPTRDACLWFIVLDGMRYDTWVRVVRPQLTERFEIKKERAYFSILPSWTQIARTSLMAGQNPDHWVGYRDRFTTEQSQLGAKLLGLSDSEQDTQLRFFSGMESDRTMEQLNRGARFPYNFLVFNISDDNLHQQRDNVATLNENVQTQLKHILNFLDGLIQPSDLVLISSDHGFMEMDEDDVIPIPDPREWEQEPKGTRNPVTFRYIRSYTVPPNLPVDDVFTFEYPNLRDGKFTVPIGKKWFQRAFAGSTDRYAHGGISFAEMVVPGALLQLIQAPRLEFALEDLLTSYEVDEGKTLSIPIRVRNRGNRSGSYELTVKADTDSTFQVLRGALNPGESILHTPSFKPVVRRGGVTTRFVQIGLSFSGANEKAIRISAREIPIHVRERRDVVEISFGGLDDLDKM